MTGENNRKLELPESFEPAGFTRDGKALYGSYEVEKKQQIGIVSLGSGKATQIIALPNGIRATIISPDGNRFAFAADPRPVDPLVEVRHVAENEESSLYVVGVNGTDGSWWCPELKDVTDYAWSGDSTRLAVVTQTQKIGHHDIRSGVYACDSVGARRVAEIENSMAGIAWANGGCRKGMLLRFCNFPP